MFRIKAACLCTASLVALTTAAAAQTEGLPETVVVTGSRVISDIANSPTPITAVTAAQLTATTPTTISQALGKLPVFMGSTGSGTSKIGSTANGAASNLNLRNFGTNRTLILFDGHRIVNTQANGAVNTDILPEMLMQRVDVVTGGAAAVYGSDAVTGVVNFILDKNFEGVKYQASVGTNQATLGTQYKMGFAAGASLFNGRGHLEGNLEYRHVDQVLSNDLPYQRNGQAYVYAGTGTAAAPYFIIPTARLNNQPIGGLISCAGCSVNNQTFVSNGVIGPYYPGQIASPAVSTLSIGGTGGFTKIVGYGPGGHNAESFARFSYNLNSNTVASVEVRASEASYANISGFNNITSGTRPNQFAVTNPYLSPTAQAQLAKGNAGCPGGVPTDLAIAPNCKFTLIMTFGTLDGASPSNPGGVQNQQSPKIPTGLPSFTYRGIDREMAITYDLTGTLGGKWDWDLYYTHDEAREHGINQVNENFQWAYAADDAVQLANGQIVCYVSTTAYAANYPGCVPINPFGPSSMTPAQYATVIFPTAFIMTNKMDDLGGTISGNIFDLPAGPIKGALSGEARWLSYQVASTHFPGSVPDCNGLRMCSTQSLLWYQGVLASIDPKRQTVYEFAGEVNVPLLKDVALAQDLSLDIAGRYTDYSLSGAVETWKVGFDYHVVDDIKFRGTMSVDIRAPTMDDFFKPASQGNTGLTDLLTGGRGDVTNFTKGNPNLVPEVAHTYTVGTVFTPTFLPNFTMSLDYYRINLYGALTQLSYATPAIQQICVASGGTSSYCSLQTRPFPFTNTSPTQNFPTALFTQNLNSATQKTEGVDVEIDYNFDLDDAIGVPGAVSLRNLTSYQPFITNVQFPGAQPTWTAMPKMRNTTFLGYKLNSWSVNLQNRWLSGYDQNTTPGQFFRTERDRHIPNYDQVDVTITKTLTLDDTTADVYLSIQDVTNAIYPLAPALNAASNPGFNYPSGGSWGYSMGRYFTVGIRGAL